MNDIDPWLWQGRRRRLLAHMTEHGGGIAILGTAPERERNRGTLYPYRADSYFYYLTGFTEPSAVVVLIADEMPRQFLFCRPKDELKESWTGYRFGTEKAAEQFGFDAAWPIDDLAKKLPELLAGQAVLWTNLAVDPDWDRVVFDALAVARTTARSEATVPQTVNELSVVLSEMRLIKDEHELALMRRAGEISGKAHQAAMRAAASGRFEYALEAELLRVFRAGGCQYPAYPSIVASGPNACVLHYDVNSRLMLDGELVLIDAGGELDGYASDITRTFPVNGRFSGAQRDLYQLVLDANKAARDEARPGQDWNAPHTAAVRVLTEGLRTLGLLSGELDDLIEAAAYKRFYIHHTGHWLGLDVHDVGQYKIDGKWRQFVPGMSFTVEPGLYIRPAEDIPEAFWNTGIRIEDNVVITETGHEVLTDSAPREIADIEACMA